MESCEESSVQFPLQHFRQQKNLINFILTFKEHDLLYECGYKQSNDGSFTKLQAKSIEIQVLGAGLKSNETSRIHQFPYHRNSKHVNYIRIKLQYIKKRNVTNCTTLISRKKKSTTKLVHTRAPIKLRSILFHKYYARCSQFIINQDPWLIDKTDKVLAIQEIRSNILFNNFDFYWNWILERIDFTYTLVPRTLHCSTNNARGDFSVGIVFTTWWLVNVIKKTSESATC